MSEQYKVVNPTSLFSGRIGCKVDSKNTEEITLVFDGPRGDVHARFHPSEIKNTATKDAWVLRLKDKTKVENLMQGEWYFNGHDEENDWLTTELYRATLFFNKEQAIEEFKKHEKEMIDRFGKHAICDFGYTNIMSNFEFVEVTVAEEEGYPV